MRHGSRAILSCTAQKDSGAFCDKPSLPDAPFPICIKHASLLLRYLNSAMPTGTEDRILLAARDFDFRPEVPRKSATAGTELVYYLRVGDKVKIGYTSDLRQRMNSYPPDSELLAVEPGDLLLERARHAQFARHLRIGREWFEPASEIMAHVAKVREQYELRQYLPPRRSPIEAQDKHGRPVTVANILR